MKAMVLDAPREPLRLDQRDIPQPGPGQLLLKVRACGVCRTDLHVVDGDLKHPILPLVPGHEVVGVVQTLGGGVSRFSVGQRVGIPWLGRACGHCPYCLRERENLYDTPLFTGYQIDGGYAEYAVADADYCFAIPDGYDDIHAAPLLCAGLIGYRAYKATGDRKILGLYGFGAAAHIVAQLAQADGRRVLALTRPGDIEHRNSPVNLGGSGQAVPTMRRRCCWMPPSSSRQTEGWFQRP
jgi:propanol-preferring alcohol dehydrogenase